MPQPAYGALSFAEQIAFFRQKKNALTESFLDVWEAQHDVSFMVAGANRDDLLADFREAVRAAIDEGGTLADFRRDFDTIVARYGWQYNGGRNWRSRVIYETNLRQSYNAGRWAQLQAVTATRPWWRYRHSDAVQHPRPLHEAKDGLVLHWTDPFWGYWFPANGWGCQCSVDALSDRDLQRLGKAGPDKAPPIDLRPVLIGQRSPGGPRIVMTPNGIDPGFGYAPGANASAWPATGAGAATPPALTGPIERALQTALRKTTRLPATEAAESAAEALSRPRAAPALQAHYEGWQRAIIAEAPHPLSIYVGALASRLVSSLVRAGASPATAAISIAADQWAGIRGKGDSAMLAYLPRLLATPLAVLREPGGLLRFLVRDGDTLMLVDVASEVGGNTVVGITNADAAALRAMVAEGRLGLIDGEIP